MNREQKSVARALVDEPGNVEYILRRFEAAAGKRLREAGLPDTRAELDEPVITETSVRRRGFEIETDPAHPAGVRSAYQVLQRSQWARDYIAADQWRDALAEISRLWALVHVSVVVEDGPATEAGRKSLRGGAAGNREKAREREARVEAAREMFAELRSANPRWSDSQIHQAIGDELGIARTTVLAYLRN